MNMMCQIHPRMEVPALARTSQRVRHRVNELAQAIGAKVNREACRQHPLMRGCLVYPSAGLVISGTICPHLWRNQCIEIAETTGFDVILLGFDPLTGVSVDILPPDGSNPLLGYLVWRCAYRGLWFIPSDGSDPFVRTGAWGIRHEDSPPFASDAQRAAGIITAITNPSFKL